MEQLGTCRKILELTYQVRTGRFQDACRQDQSYKTVQQQMNEWYNGYVPLIDWLMKTVDVHRMKDALTHRQPRTSHKLIEGVAKEFIHESETARKSVAL